MHLSDFEHVWTSCSFKEGSGKKSCSQTNPRTYGTILYVTEELWKLKWLKSMLAKKWQRGDKWRPKMVRSRKHLEQHIDQHFGRRQSTGSGSWGLKRFTVYIYIHNCPWSIVDGGLGLKRLKRSKNQFCSITIDLWDIYRFYSFEGLDFWVWVTTVLCKSIWDHQKTVCKLNIEVHGKSSRYEVTIWKWNMICNMRRHAMHI